MSMQHTGMNSLCLLRVCVSIRRKMSVNFPSYKVSSQRLKVSQQTFLLVSYWSFAIASFLLFRCCDIMIYIKYMFGLCQWLMAYRPQTVGISWAIIKIGTSFVIVGFLPSVSGIASDLERWNRCLFIHNKWLSVTPQFMLMRWLWECPADEGGELFVEWIDCD